MFIKNKLQILNKVHCKVFIERKIKLKVADNNKLLKKKKKSKFRSVQAGNKDDY